MNHLRLVFQRVREHELYVKKEKCEFTQRHITFLGRKIEEGLIKIDEAKVQAIKDWHVPSKVTLANYYRRYIRGYFKIVAPFTNLLKKDIH